MTTKEQILNYYYEEKLNTIEISNKLKVTKQYVSKVIKVDSRYSDEKAQRKLLNHEKHKKQVNECVKKNKQAKRKDREYDSMKVLQRQAAIELSSHKSINNRAFRNWNSSIYEFHNNTKEFRVKKEFENKVSYAVPRKVKWDWVIYYKRLKEKM